MTQYIEAKVRYEKTLDNGMQKKVTEPYLVDAMSFTEAEKRTAEEIAPYISGDFSVSAVKKSNISEIFFSEETADDKFYKVKVNFISINEKTLKEKKTASYMLVQAGTFQKALKNFEKNMNGTMADYQIASISETKIMDVFKVKPKQQEEQKEATADE